MYICYGYVLDTYPYIYTIVKNVLHSNSLEFWLKVCSVWVFVSTKVSFVLVEAGRMPRRCAATSFFSEKISAETTLIQSWFFRCENLVFQRCFRENQRCSAPNRLCFRKKQRWFSAEFERWNLGFSALFRAESGLLRDFQVMNSAESGLRLSWIRADQRWFALGLQPGIFSLSPDNRNVLTSFWRSNFFKDGLIVGGTDRRWVHYTKQCQWCLWSCIEFCPQGPHPKCFPQSQLPPKNEKRMKKGVHWNSLKLANDP